MSTRPEWYQPPAPRSRLWRWLPAGVTLVVVVAGLLAVFAATETGPFGFSDSAQWSAVLINDDEVFFGHLQVLQSDKLELTDVYYVVKTAGTGTGTSTNPEIVSLVANQLQCPRDYIWIDRRSVRYWEDLQDSSFVVQRLNSLGTSPKTCVQPSGATNFGPSASPTP